MSDRQAAGGSGQRATILLVENAKLFHQMVGEALGERLDIDLIHAHSLAEAAQAIEKHGHLTLVLTGLVLSDGDQEKIVDFFLSRQLPTVIVTGVFDEEVRKRLLERPIIDYVLKNAPGAVDYLVWLVQRLDRNRRITALVVDDAASARMHASSLLRLYGFQVVEAEGGEQGLKKLTEDPTIRLVITDQEMPGMDGVEFTRRLRAQHPRDTVSVIGVSGAGRSTLVAQFLKNGANDFLHKPFSREEFFCRVSQNVENLELIGSLQDLATKDFLTGLANRRHFFARGAELMAQAKAGKRRACVAMLDIDLFKRINDTYGHDGGDVALKAVASALARFARPQDLVARFGGEEFAVIAMDLGETESEYFFEGLRARIENLAVQFGEHRIPVTTSIGVCVDRLDSLDAMLTEADRLLYLAKAGGRNQVRRSNDPANAA
ncbi:diguanylate cyclase [Pseudomarimonas salicorniae]|uniref:diguanylate cyclase n=1 Tax=Pseudomarimonas salicorniae TaxID=2933270 RepID=A0ABT0GH25_9GAMM|nr:diguanylate cyclase [Lysobacter sp. CAU 1642]MCK7593841.1 diguanylate cyclase [Lysobacter sp. CAU 1642]